jgi:hypothetical protein
MLLFCDGFDHYATADILKKWSAVNFAPNINATTGRRGGGAIGGLTNGRYVKKVLAANTSDTVIAGFAINPTNTDSGGRIFLVTDSAGFNQFDLYLNANNQVLLRKYANTTASTLATSAKVLPINAYSYIEVKVKLSSTTTGTYEVRINGGVAFAVTTVVTRNTSSSTDSILSFILGGIDTNTPIPWLDDFYICDGSGSANNDFLGDVRIDTLYPNGAGTNTQFTSSNAGGTHRYWRVNLDMSGSPVFTEMQFRTTSGGANVATGGTAMVSGNVFSGSASNLFDGSTATTMGFNSATSNWIGYDFGAGNEKAIQEVTLAAGSSGTSQTPGNLLVQYSDNGTDWVTSWAPTPTNWGASQTITWTFSPPTANWSTVDETPPNTYDYNSSATVGNKDSYALQNLPLASTTVKAIQVNNALSKSDAGARSAANLIRSSTTEAQSSALALSTSPLYLSSVHETDPATTAAWTVSGVNALEAGTAVTA